MDEDFEHLSLRIRSESVQQKDGHSTRPRHCPETLNILSGYNRLRSPTQLSMSSVPESVTTYAPSTMASPMSSSFGDLQDLLMRSRRSSRATHQPQPSSGACSTFVNDDDDASVVVGASDLAAKIRELGDDKVKFESDVEDSSQETLPFSPSRVKDDERTPHVGSSEEFNSPFSKCDTNSTTSEDYSSEDAETILDFALQLVYGVDRHDTTVAPAESLHIAHKFIRELSQCIWQTAPHTQAANTIPTSRSPSSTAVGEGTGHSQRGGKRKKHTDAGGREEEGDGFSDGDGDGSLPLKRLKPNPKEDENLRLSCPFRKRNPHRFNVRDHHSCAMTFFPKFAELRQHIVKQHKRDDPSAFVCDRCNRDFATRKDLRDHQRLPKDQICEIADIDPESGIDGPTSNKLLSRKRASSSCPNIQWHEIWNILFPDDDDRLVQDYHFIPVIEHFELSNNFLSSLSFLKSSLSDKMANPNTLETLATKFHHCFLETVERCIAQAQNMPYANRSNKRHEQLATLSTTPRKKGLLPRPDSGVVVDDGSEESGSVLGGPLKQSQSMRTARAGLTAISPSVVLRGTPMLPHMPSNEIQAWTNELSCTQSFETLGEGFEAGSFNLQPDLTSWAQAFYPNLGIEGIEGDFSGLHGN